MNRFAIVDLLACPIDKYSPLELFSIRFEGDSVIIGALLCNQCGRYYPIRNGTPAMLPDSLRDRKSDIEFLEEFQRFLPDKITIFGNPWHL